MRQTFRGRPQGVCGKFREARRAWRRCSIVVDGRPVVDLWGGHADKAKTRPWQRDTLVNVYSTTKGLTATCAHRLIDQGKLDPDEPVSKYWPEFAQAGKKDLPVRYLLSHRAGLPGDHETAPKTRLFDWDTMASALAEQEPFVAAGNEAWLSRNHDRMAGRRSHPADHAEKGSGLIFARRLRSRSDSIRTSVSMPSMMRA